ncbi:hydroxymethylglutaryl- lyase [Fusarium albosuccineum]|uniref:Hydroxymethylglutaryl- lyase n=1 Tax=Fusarium albosuccineum TaxID=1237068 RepID=A0A8H4PDW5_9HYPO|nr:hydroxymethylglutaryl- lyase [Fusarium albosuccineum]
MSAVPSPSSLNWALDIQDEELSIYRSDRNRKIVLSRPRNGNALTTAMVSRLTNFFHEASRDKHISRIIITAQGKFFCTGMDLGKSRTAVNQGEDASSNEYHKFVGLFQAIQDSPQVTIAVINGPCYAGGIGLAFSCDIRLAVVSATATLSEVKLGLCPAIISRYLVREWGAVFTREAMLSGRTVSMTELKGIGAVHGIADDIPRLEELTTSYLRRLRACAPLASTMCKEAVTVACSIQVPERRHAVIQRIFKDMMRDGSESSVGVRNFQAKKQQIDWDALHEPGTLSKL